MQMNNELLCVTLNVPLIPDLWILFPVSCCVNYELHRPFKSAETDVRSFALQEMGGEGWGGWGGGGLSHGASGWTADENTSNTCGFITWHVFLQTLCYACVCKRCNHSGLRKNWCMIIWKDMDLFPCSMFLFQRAIQRFPITQHPIIQLCTWVCVYL